MQLGSRLLLASQKQMIGFPIAEKSSIFWWGEGRGVANFLYKKNTGGRTFEFGNVKTFL